MEDKMQKIVSLAKRRGFTPQLFSMWYVYILKSSKHGQRYIGMTNDLRKRFQLHNNGKVFSTQNGRPWKLLYYEAHWNKYDAAAREKFLKSGWGKNWINKTLSNFLTSSQKVGRTSSNIHDHVTR